MTCGCQCVTERGCHRRNTRFAHAAGWLIALYTMNFYVGHFMISESVRIEKLLCSTRLSFTVISPFSAWDPVKATPASTWQWKIKGIPVLLNFRPRDQYKYAGLYIRSIHETKIENYIMLTLILKDGFFILLINCGDTIKLVLLIQSWQCSTSKW